MAEKRDFTFKVNRDGHAESAEITYDYHQDMIVTLKGVDPDDIVNMLTDDEIASQVDLEDMLKALNAKHGTGEVVTALSRIPGDSVFSILDILYENAENDVRDWVDVHIGGNE